MPQGQDEGEASEILNGLLRATVPVSPNRKGPPIEVILPVEILKHILSFLDLKNQIKASIICRVWRDTTNTLDWGNLIQFTLGKKDPHVLESVGRHAYLFFSPLTYPYLVEDGLVFAELSPDLIAFVQENPAAQKFLEGFGELKQFSVRIKKAEEHPLLKKQLGATRLLAASGNQFAQEGLRECNFVSKRDLEDPVAQNVAWYGYLNNQDLWIHGVFCVQRLSCEGFCDFCYWEREVRANLRVFTHESYLFDFLLDKLMRAYAEHNQLEKAVNFVDRYCPKLMHYANALITFSSPRIGLVNAELPLEEGYHSRLSSLQSHVEALFLNASHPRGEKVGLSLTECYLSAGNFEKAFSFVHEHFLQDTRAYVLFLTEFNKAFSEYSNFLIRRDSVTNLLDCVMADVAGLKYDALMLREGVRAYFITGQHEKAFQFFEKYVPQNLDAYNWFLNEVLNFHSTYFRYSDSISGQEVLLSNFERFLEKVAHLMMNEASVRFEEAKAAFERVRNEGIFREDESRHRHEIGKEH